MILRISDRFDIKFYFLGKPFFMTSTSKNVTNKTPAIYYNENRDFPENSARLQQNKNSYIFEQHEQVPLPNRADLHLCRQLLLGVST